MQLQSHFLRLPAELRNIIYEYLLIPPPSKAVECAYLASTSRPQENSILTIGGNPRGSSLNTSLLRVNKQCHGEGAAVLYGNTQIIIRQNMPKVPNVALPHVGRLELCLDSTTPTALHISHVATMLQRDLPGVRGVSLQVCFDFTRDESIAPLDWRPLLELDTERVSFVIDIHVTGAWEFDGFWWERFTIRQGHEEAAKRAEDEAFRMRGLLIGCMEQWAKEEGKRFRVLDG